MPKPEQLVSKLIILLCLASGLCAAAETPVCLPCIRQDMATLADPRMHGRGSATVDEFRAAEFAANRLQSFGFAPAAPDHSYIQKAPLPGRLQTTTPPRTETWNVLAELAGTEKTHPEVILLSAHLDHLGMRSSGKGTLLFPGADDDASGVTAVLELAQALAVGPRPRRSILVALFGSEELGGIGSQFFLDHPPLPLRNIVANLEFEMLGRPDPLLHRGQLWLTGYERSDLGQAMAHHGAPVTADPHPEQQFFQRSDNFLLARKGIVAQTLSSFGLHKDYHQPGDDLTHIDFDHMSQAISGIYPSILWLANTDWRPSWSRSGRP